jgi:hypothetical protein
VAAGVSLAALLAQPAAAQLPRLTLGGVVLGAGRDPAFAGAGPVLAARLAGQVRLRTLVLVGRRGDATAFRGESVFELVLDPAARWSPFAGGGVAASADRAERMGLLVVTFGVERRPEGRASWWVETGVGGGIRLGLGYRFALGAHPGRPRRRTP